MTSSNYFDSGIGHKHFPKLRQIESINSIEDIWEYVEGNALGQLKINLVNYQRKRNGLPEISNDISNGQLKSAYDEINLFILGRQQISWDEYILDLKENIEEYKWLCSVILKDHISKDVFFNLLYSRLTLSKEHLRAAFCSEIQYFDERIVTFLNEEILVD